MHADFLVIKLTRVTVSLALSKLWLLCIAISHRFISVVWNSHNTNFKEALMHAG